MFKALILTDFVELNCGCPELAKLDLDLTWSLINQILGKGLTSESNVSCFRIDHNDLDQRKPLQLMEDKNP